MTPLFERLFFWAFVAVVVWGVLRPRRSKPFFGTFISASGVLSMILIGGAAQGINGLFMVVAVQLAALLASYVAMLAERRSAAVSDDAVFHASAHNMAKAAAHNSLLSLISGRTGPSRTGPKAKGGR